MNVLERSAIFSLITRASHHPLNVNYFRNLCAGIALSALGDQFYNVALSWSVLQMTGSSATLGSMLMLAAVPRTLMMLFGGLLCDRISPRRILICATSARMILVGLLAAITSISSIHLEILYALTIAFGFADAFTAPAMGTLVPTLVTADQLYGANSVTQAITPLCAALGPIAAGVMVKRFGSSAVFAFDSASFIFLIMSLYMVPEKPRPVMQSSSGIWVSIGDGIRCVIRDPSLRYVTLFATAVNLCLSGPVAVGLATLAKVRFDSPTALGALFSAFGAGTLIGMILAGAIGRQLRRRGWTLLILSAVVGLGFMALPFLMSLVATVLALAVMGVAGGFMDVQVVSWVQLRVANEFLGRVMSVLILTLVGLAPISIGVTGFAVQMHMSLTFLSAGICMTLSAVAFAMSKHFRSIE